uniref:Uncharacterized protein n=1 Tax=Amphiprion percula TaxID=161767 RepID=A0A3P8TCE3_AMPPE
RKNELLKGEFPPPNYYVHAFYCTWFGSPKFDCKYIHWDHPQMCSPLDGIGSNFYPSVGLRTATIGVIFGKTLNPDNGLEIAQCASLVLICIKSAQTQEETY